MKKIVRLTERDLTRIVKRVIKENEDQDQTRHSQNRFLKFMQDEIDKIADESYDINDFDEMIEEFYNEFEEELNKYNNASSSFLIFSHLQIYCNLLINCFSGISVKQIILHLD